jgi:PST family polysaccharide transporter
VNLTYKTISAGNWKLAAVAGQGMLELLVIAVLARFIEAEEFGIVAIATMVTTFATMLSEGGIGSALIQIKNITADHIRVSFTIAMILALLFYFLLLSCAYGVALFFKEPAVLKVLQVLSLLFIIKGIGATSRSLLIRELDFKKLMIVELSAYALGYVLVSFTLAFLGYGVWALVWAILFHNALSSVFFYFICPHSILPSLSRDPLRQLFYFGGGLTFSRIFHFLGNNVDALIIGRLLGATALGIYGRALRLMKAPVDKLGNIIDQVMFPALATIQDKTHRLGKAYIRSIELSNVIMLPFSTIMIIFSRDVVSIILGTKWMAAALPFQILMLSAAMKISVRMSDSLVRATGMVYQSALFKSLYALAAVAGCWVGHHFGLPGVAFGVLSAALVVNFLMVRLSLGLTANSWKNYFQALIPGILLSLAIIAVNWPFSLMCRTLNCSSANILIGGMVLTMTLMITLRLSCPQIMGKTLNLLIEEVPFAHRCDDYIVSTREKLLHLLTSWK